MASSDQNHSDPPPSGPQWLPAKRERPDGVYVSFGGRVGKIVATLRLSGDDLEPSEVSALLGTEATGQHRKGDPVDRSGRGRRTAGSWRLHSALPGTATLDEHIKHLLGRVSSQPAVWDDLRRYTPDIFTGIFLTAFNQGDSLTPDTARMLADRGILLAIDVYSHSPNEGAGRLH